MKRHFLFATLFLLGFNVFAQKQKNKKNEITTEPFFWVLSLTSNFTYERLINEDTGLGLSFASFIGNSTEKFVQFTPFYRHYLSNTFASGFFIEAYTPITSYSVQETSSVPTEFGYNLVIQNKEGVSMAAAIAGGGKWVTHNSFVFDASLGAGYIFLNPSSSSFTYKIRIGIGYRF